jgi:hypothetical protein
MKKTKVAMLCALVACLLTACDDFCIITKGAPKTTYTWSYTNNGTTSSGEFTTDQYGDSSFDVPDGTDCNKVDLKEKGDGVKIAPEAPPIS